MFCILYTYCIIIIGTSIRDVGILWIDKILSIKLKKLEQNCKFHLLHANFKLHFNIYLHNYLEKVEYTYTNGFDGLCNWNVRVLNVLFMAFPAASVEKMYCMLSKCKIYRWSVCRTSKLNSNFKRHEINTMAITKL